MAGMARAPPPLFGAGSGAPRRAAAAAAAAGLAAAPPAPGLRAGRGRPQDTPPAGGLAGGFNATILREARRKIRELQAAGKTVKVLTIGRKGRDSLRRDYSKLIVESLIEVGRKRLAYSEAREIGEKVVAMFNAGGFDVCTLIYKRLQSAINQML